ncbi:DNA-3-methyladenine glycosylase family protein [Paenibacillus sp. NPDC058071]|uniref:DNA-3-methyladenine glycosylase family protein n=1 Tax=Paenibacillus sp. NPDC058071 TaxID=3346326 RepID=UPI0036DACB1C
MQSPYPYPYTASNDGKEIRLEAPVPFSFDQNLSYLSRAAGESMHRVLNGCVRKAILVPNETEAALIEVDGQEDGLTIRFLSPDRPQAPEALQAAADYIAEWFDLRNDLKPFYKLAEHDPLLQPTIESYWGLRTIGIPDLFEALCWGIIGQQINLPFAYTLKRRFVERYGEAVVYDGESYWLFPEPETVATLTVEQLTELQLTSRKSEYLIGVAGLIAEGTLTKEKLLAAGGLKAAERMLVGIRGIGPWTANYVLMRCLRSPDAFPIDDVGLHNAIKHVAEMDRKPTKDEITAMSAEWSGWEAYATFYLWRLLY